MAKYEKDQGVHLKEFIMKCLSLLPAKRYTLDEASKSKFFLSCHNNFNQNDRETRIYLSKLLTILPTRRLEKLKDIEKKNIRNEKEIERLKTENDRNKTDITGLKQEKQGLEEVISNQWSTRAVSTLSSCAIS